MKGLPIASNSHGMHHGVKLPAAPSIGMLPSAPSTLVEQNRSAEPMAAVSAAPAVSTAPFSDGDDRCMSEQPASLPYDEPASLPDEEPGALAEFRAAGLFAPPLSSEWAARLETMLEATRAMSEVDGAVLRPHIGFLLRYVSAVRRARALLTADGNDGPGGTVGEEADIEAATPMSEALDADEDEVQHHVASSQGWLPEGSTEQLEVATLVRLLCEECGLCCTFDYARPELVEGELQ